MHIGEEIDYQYVGSAGDDARFAACRSIPSVVDHVRRSLPKSRRTSRRARAPRSTGRFDRAHPCAPCSPLYAHLRRNGAINNAERIDAHNAAWLRADPLFAGITNPLILSYPRETFLGSVSHPWGLHAVHYTDDFYRAFWRQLKSLLDSHAR